MTRPAFVNNYQLIVSEDTFGTGIFPGTVFAVAILESSDSLGNVGGSQLTLQGNNWFGIEAGPAWTGPTIDFQDANGNLITYRAYPDFESSLMDFIELLTANSRYNPVTSAPDPLSQMQALQDTGYNSSPGYGGILQSIYATIQGYLPAINQPVPPGAINPLPGQVGPVNPALILVLLAAFALVFLSRKGQYR